MCVCVVQNPGLVKRLEKIKRKQEQKEYDRMVRNVDNSVSHSSSCDIVALLARSGTS